MCWWHVIPPPTRTHNLLLSVYIFIFKEGKVYKYVSRKFNPMLQTLTNACVCIHCNKRTKAEECHIILAVKPDGAFGNSEYCMYLYGDI